MAKIKKFTLENTKVLLKWDSLSYKNKFIRVRDEGDKISLTLKKDLNKKTPISKTIHVNDYDTTVDILQEIGVIRKYRVEKIREIWKLKDGCEINFDMFPGLPYYMEIKSNNKSKAIALIKTLGLELDNRNHNQVGADTMYYDRYGIPKKRKDMGDLTFSLAKKIFTKHITKNKKEFNNILNKQLKIIKNIK